MSLRVRAALRARHQDEDGIALFVALLGIIVLSGLSTLFLARTLTEQRASGVSRNNEIAVHAAEASAEEVLSRVNVSTTAAPYTTADPSGSPHEYDATSFASVDDERAWAIQQATNAVTADPDALLDTREGEAYGIRPVDPSGAPVDVIFGVGFVPAFGAENVRIRVVKYQIDEDLFTPAFAFLAGADLPINGNGSILAPGCSTDPDDCDADVHVNGDVLKGSSGSYVIEGRVSVANGTCPSGGVIVGGCVATSDGAEEEPVPDVEARDFYNREVDNLNPDSSGAPTEWYDLCPDGTVRGPSAAGPCDPTQPVIWPDGSGTRFRGWQWRNPQNTWQATAVDSGVYYVYQADADVNGSTGVGPRAVSIFVERDPAKPTRSGSLATGGNPKLEAAFPDVLFVADADLKMKGTGGAGTTELAGFITAREQVDVGGTVSLDGAIIMQDREDVHGLVTRSTMGISGNLTLTYARNLQIDLTGVWTITYWNEI